MSLPSDVTVDNFRDFYAMILPYLNVGNGGTSDTPLGQVAFFDDTVAPAGWLIADGTVYNISDYPDLATQYERVHGSKNFYGGNGTTTFAVPDWDAIPAEVFGNANIICVKAVPSSEMNTYSTTERRVGTWIDGKPLYQKTWTGLTTQSGADARGKILLELSSLNIKDVIKIEGFIGIGADYSVPINCYNDAQFYVTTRWENDSSQAQVRQVCAGWYNRPEAITMQYTKTTD